MIFGIGIDVVSTSRIARLIEKYGGRFLERIFSKEEITEGLTRTNSAEHFAARFAAREAFFKALGTGWGRGLALREVAVTKNNLGRPVLVCTGNVEKTLNNLNIENSHLSLTHEGDIAMAIVILEGGGNE
jgi:holo-[acyl-carrier protein] synthase